MERVLGHQVVDMILGDRDPAYAAALGELCGAPEWGLRLAAVATDAADLLAAAASRPEAVILLDPGLAPDPGALAAELAAAGRRVILLVPDLAGPRPGALAGANLEAVFKYSLGVSLAAAIRRLPPAPAGGSGQSLPDHGSRPLPGSAGAPAPGSQQGLLPQQAGPAGAPATVAVLAVCSPKGGTGKSLLAASLAACWAARGVPVLLADLAPFGGAAPLLRLPQGARGLSAAISALRQEPLPDPAALAARLRSAAAAYAVGGGHHLDVLTAAAPRKMDQLDPDSMAHLLAALGRTGHQVVVLDTPAGLPDRLLPVLTAASRILLVATPDVGCAWQCLQYRELLEAQAVPMDRVALAVNRMSRRIGFSLAEFRALLDLPLAGTLPDDAAVPAACNRGRLPGGRYGRAVSRLAGALFPAHSPGEVTSRPWPWTR